MLEELLPQLREWTLAHREEVCGALAAVAVLNASLGAWRVARWLFRSSPLSPEAERLLALMRETEGWQVLDRDSWPTTATLARTNLGLYVHFICGFPNLLCPRSLVLRRNSVELASLFSRRECREIRKEYWRLRAAVDQTETARRLALVSSL